VSSAPSQPFTPRPIAVQDEFMVVYSPFLIGFVGIACAALWAVLLAGAFWPIIHVGLSFGGTAYRLFGTVLLSLLGPLTLAKYLLSAKIKDSVIRVEHTFRLRVSEYSTSDIVAIVRTSKPKTLDTVLLKFGDGKKFRFDALATNYGKLIMFLSEVKSGPN
jgi:hypothetical protein